MEWLQALGGRVSGRILASSGTFQYFAAAAPGAKELVSMVKIWQLTRAGRRRGSGSFDLVVLDAPATWTRAWAAALAADLRSDRPGGTDRGPDQAGAGAARRPRRKRLSGSGAGQRDVRQRDDSSCRTRCDAQLGRSLEAVIVNGLLPKRFSGEELKRVGALGVNGGSRDVGSAASEEEAVVEAAARAARTAHERSRLQHNQLARLRRRGFEVVPVPFVLGPGLDLTAVERSPGVSHASSEPQRAL